MIRAIVMIIVFIFPYHVCAEVADAELIKEAKLLNVNSLEESLPNISLEKWLLNLSGYTKPIKWEVNDCGEQDGSGKQTDFPICVEAQLNLGNNNHIGIMIVLGTYRKGIVGKAEIWMIYLIEDEKLTVIRGLEEVELYTNKE